MANFGGVSRPLLPRHVTVQDYPGLFTPEPLHPGTERSDDSSGFRRRERSACCCWHLLVFASLITGAKHPDTQPLKVTTPSKPLRPQDDGAADPARAWGPPWPEGHPMGVPRRGGRVRSALSRKRSTEVSPFVRQRAHPGARCQGAVLAGPTAWRQLGGCGDPRAGEAGTICLHGRGGSGPDAARARTQARADDLRPRRPGPARHRAR